MHSNSVLKDKRLLLSLTFRTLQSVSTLVALCLSAFAMTNDYFPYFSTPCALSASCVCAIYLTLCFSIHRHMPVVVVTILDAFFVLFWLAASIYLVYDFRHESCSFSSYEDYKYERRQCMAAKAATAFTFLNFVLFVITFALQLLYAVIPSLTSKSSLTHSGTLKFGCVFLSRSQPDLSDAEVDGKNNRGFAKSEDTAFHE